MHEENYFEARKRHMVDQFEEMFRVEAKNIELRERQYYQHQNQMMIEEFSEILIEELNRLEEQLKEEQKKSLKNQKILLDLEWEQKFKQAVDECVREMTIKFIDELDRQKFILMNNFKLELQ